MILKVIKIMNIYIVAVKSYGTIEGFRNDGMERYDFNRPKSKIFLI